MNPTDQNTQLQPANATPTPPSAAVALRPPREVRVVADESPMAYLMDTARFEHCYRIATTMARASLIPAHLKGEDKEATTANCFLIVNQALRWELDPFSVAPETYVVGGKLGFQGKLVAAVINSRAGLAEKLSYEFSGKEKTDDYTITVSGRLNGENLARTVTVRVGDVRTDNKMWSRDPSQKLVYTGAIKWARRHKPEVILGVLTDDDADAIKEEARLEKLRSAGPSFGQVTVDSPPVKSRKAAALPAASTALATSPEPPPAAQEPATSTPSTAVEFGDYMVEAGVSFDDFTDWCVTTGYFVDAKNFAQYDQLPEAFVTKLRADTKAMAKLVKIYAKKGAQP